MSKVKVLIVEDEAIIADSIFDTLEELGYEVIEPANTFSEAIQLIESEKPDIAILDIQLGGKKSGVDLAIRINQEYKFPFLFLSSNTDKITLEEAKNVQPFAYLVKPFAKEELYTSIEVALYNFAKQAEQALDQENLIIHDALFIKANKAFVRLNFKDVVYLKSDHIYIDVYLNNGKKFSVRGSLNEYMNKLGSMFFRTHRSFIVNLDYLQEVKQTKVVVNELEIPLGQNQKEELLAKLNKG